jgi:hypothetical protein
MNSVLEQQLFSALTQLDATVKTMATTIPKPNLLPIFTQIDELTPLHYSRR